MPPVLKGDAVSDYASSRSKKVKGKNVESTVARNVEAPKQALEEKLAQLDFEDIVFKEVFTHLPKGKGLADSMWADPGTKPLVIAPNNVFGMKTDYIHNPIQDGPRSSSPTPSSLNPQAGNFSPCDISPTVSQHTEIRFGSTNTPLSTPASKSFPASAISMDYTKVTGYVPPHLKGTSVANPVVTPMVAEYTPPHLISCLDPNSVATPKADDSVSPQINESPSVSVAMTPKAPEYIPPHLRASMSTSSTAASKPAQNLSVHQKGSSVTGSITTSKAPRCISPTPMTSTTNFITTPKSADYTLPHLRATKPTQVRNPPTLANRDQDHAPSSLEVSVSAAVKNTDWVPSNLRSKPNLKITLIDSNIIDSTIPSKECKSATPVSLSPALKATSARVGDTRPTIPTKMANTSSFTAPSRTSNSQSDFKLACSWEEFTRGKHPDASAMNTTKCTGSAVPSIMEPSRATQDSSINRSRANYASTSGKGSQYTIQELIKHNQQLDLSKPIEANTATVLGICSPAKNKKPDPLTRDALIKIAGTAPCEFAISGVEQAVSDAGVDEVVKLQNEKTSLRGKQQLDDDKRIPDVRGNIAPEAVDLHEWDGSWAPVPCSWENERSEFCNDFVPTYIAEWRKGIELDDSQTVDMKADEFATGASALCNKNFLEPIQHPPSYPDVAGSENIQKQRLQHVESDCKNYLRRQLKKKRIEDQSALLDAQRRAEIDAAYEAAGPEPNPHAPVIAIYLRPAEERDVSGITEIYNHYVRNSIIPEDQEPVDERDIRSLLSDVRSDAHPFVVAILGQPPKDPSRHAKKFNSRYPTAKSVAQSEEHVVGFTFVNSYYGFASTTCGRSRYTGNLQIYVHHKYTRKGVGRSLLDRILMCTCSTHAARGGYDWVEPKDPLEARIYCDGGGNGPRRYHQLLIERPIERKFDPDHEWLKRWLNRFFFTQAGRFLATARSRAPESGRWLDVLTFQKSATIDGEIVGCV